MGLFPYCTPYFFPWQSILVFLKVTWESGQRVGKLNDYQILANIQERHEGKSEREGWGWGECVCVGGGGGDCKLTVERQG